MPQPKKYSSAAERQAAYRERHAKARHNAVLWELGELRQKISRRRKQAEKQRRPVTALELAKLLDYIEGELDKLTRSS